MAPKRTATPATTGPVPAPSPPTMPSASSSSAPAASSSLSSGPKTLTQNSSIYDIAHTVWQQYLATTPQRTMLLDAFMGFLVLVGGVQFVYCVVGGNYPFNAFLSGFCAAVGQFVLTASLRMQTSAATSSSSTGGVGGGGSKGKGGKKVVKGDAGEEGSGVSAERAFADYVFGSLILHFFCINFIN
ncbi:putative oligosaccharyl transferase subunit Dad1 [Aspergillus vadensis CBS 113365]|uniref:Dolichyl-diphosphooligosaccharide--protein glycosyltransferase subunit OST2 n=1 Tax=Aspergillus vadensis (strain CBS 113365 / IMI 142717 / IBT 24658) TaxID=1448311 RepID=A0A319CTM0_ASPVC|nr:defender against death DAD protein [Aspergillus vadensis CBS 113365]PYH71602.1 defender against death DAD protein [Aspergillus vadensis CBS 113365]